MAERLQMLIYFYRKQKNKSVVAVQPENKNSLDLQGHVVTVGGAQMVIDKTLAEFRLRLDGCGGRQSVICDTTKTKKSQSDSLRTRQKHC